MLELLTYIAILYIIGCVLGYGRFYASMDYAYRKGWTDTQISFKVIFEDSDVLAIILFSWFTFFVGVSIYFEDGEDNFLKFKP